jgi:hypothetical protein
MKLTLADYIRRYRLSAAAAGMPVASMLTTVAAWPMAHWRGSRPRHPAAEMPDDHLLVLRMQMGGASIRMYVRNFGRRRM